MYNKRMNFTPGQEWKDTEGKVIQAHGGGILRHKGIYYWYGENKDGETLSQHRVDVIGVSCYSSEDLYNWKNEGIVLPAVNACEAHDLHPSKVLERPKVIYNEATRQFVMFMHIDRADYSYAAVGIAVSHRPDGEFKYIGSVNPNGLDSRDMTVFKDDDGTAYLLYSSQMNSRLNITPLAEDYLSVKSEYKSYFISDKDHGSRESPAVFKYKGKYYMITSGCTGWNCNEAEYAVAGNMLGEWEPCGNPCVGENAHKTFYSQDTFVLPVQGKEGKFIFMADRWNKEELRDSRYVWLPINMEDGKLSVKWMDSWDLSVFE